MLVEKGNGRLNNKSLIKQQKHGQTKVAHLIPSPAKIKQSFVIMNANLLNN